MEYGIRLCFEPQRKQCSVYRLWDREDMGNNVVLDDLRNSVELSTYSQCDPSSAAYETSIVFALVRFSFEPISLSWLPYLRKVVIQDFTNAGWISDLCLLENLKMLEVNCHDLIPDEWTGIMKDVAKCPKLKTLKVACRYPIDLSPLTATTTIRTLKLADIQVVNYGGFRSFLSEMKTVEVLCLHSVGIQLPTGMGDCKKEASCDCSYDVYCTCKTSTSLVGNWISGLSGMCSLRSLTIECCFGLENITSVLMGLPTLYELRIRHAIKLKDDAILNGVGIIALGLKNVELYNCYMGEQMLRVNKFRVSSNTRIDGVGKFLSQLTYV